MTTFGFDVVMVDGSVGAMYPPRSPHPSDRPLWRCSELSGPPRPSFSDIWEREGRWSTGPHVLASIVGHVKGKGPVASLNPRNPTDMSLRVPLPACAYSVPEELHARLNRCLHGATTTWLKGVDLSCFLDRQATAHTIADANAYLASVEYGRTARDDHAQLYRLLADRFGLLWFALPKPLFAEGEDQGEVA